MSVEYQVIVKTLPQDAPYDFEMSASLIIANYFRRNVVFLRPGHLKSPDLLIGSSTWELKSPKGNSKNTISNCIRGARKQSTNIIIDLRRCKMNSNQAIARIRHTYKRRRRKTGTYLIIKKDGSVVDVNEIL